MEVPPQRPGCCWRQTGFSNRDLYSWVAVRLPLSTFSLGEVTASATQAALSWEGGRSSIVLPLLMSPSVCPTPVACWTLSPGRLGLYNLSCLWVSAQVRTLQWGKVLWLLGSTALTKALFVYLWIYIWIALWVPWPRVLSTFFPLCLSN